MAATNGQDKVAVTVDPDAWDGLPGASIEEKVKGVVAANRRARGGAAGGAQRSTLAYQTRARQPPRPPTAALPPCSPLAAGSSSSGAAPARERPTELENWLFACSWLSGAPRCRRRCVLNASGSHPPPLLPSAPCSFCIEVSRTLVEMGVPFVYYRVDQIGEGAQVGLGGAAGQAASLSGAALALAVRASGHASGLLLAPHCCKPPPRLRLPLPQLHEELKRLTGQKTVP